MVVEIQRVDRVVEFYSQAVFGIEPPCLGNQPLGELGINPPISCLVGILQSGAAHRFAKAHVIELGGLR